MKNLFFAAAIFSLILLSCSQGSKPETHEDGEHSHAGGGTHEHEDGTTHGDHHAHQEEFVATPDSDSVRKSEREHSHVDGSHKH